VLPELAREERFTTKAKGVITHQLKWGVDIFRVKDMEKQVIFAIFNIWIIQGDSMTLITDW
jgi:hypothetical protein